MFYTPILDVAISLVFLYFILSVIMSAVSEVLSNALDFRGKDLEGSIKKFLYDDNWKDYADKILESSHIKALQTKENKFPSSIPSSAFASAVIESIGTVNKIAIDGSEIFKLNLPQDVVNSQTGRMINTLVSKATIKVDDAKKYLEDQFDHAMVELKTEYKKKIQKIVFVIALILSIALNIDTINVVVKLWQDPILRQKSAAQVSDLIKNNKNYFQKTVDKIKNDSSHAAVNNSTPVSTTQAKVDSIKTYVQGIQKADSILAASSLPMGWIESNIPQGSTQVWGWLSKLIGILLTSFAVMLGAPFWFDVINKLTSVKKQ